MSPLDWGVLIASLVFIVVYGVWKGRGSKNIEGYLMADRGIRWYIVALSVMATQASAITFLSTPGQSYSEGIGFVQFYFGLPLAMIVLCVTVVPLFHRLNVYTAYEYLEKRFDLKTRGLAAFLFLIQRGLAAGLTIYAPAIILSTLLHLEIYLTNLVLGVLVIIYTALGGSKAVSMTQTQQMIIIFAAMAGAFFMILHLLPQDVSFSDAMFVAGKMGKLDAVDFSFDITHKYNIWSGLIGGFFLALSYFGTDQSQVQRYLTGKSVTHSRLGLLTNGVVKVPMQFFILLLGVLVFVFYQYHTPPLFFNTVEESSVRSGPLGQQYQKVENQYRETSLEKNRVLRQLMQFRKQGDEKNAALAQSQLDGVEIRVNALKKEGVSLIRRHTGVKDAGDANYVFLYFILRYMPVGLLGLIIAAIVAASMSSTASELNALASTTVVDIYKRMIRADGDDRHYLWISKAATALWGLFAIGFAMFANRLGTLVEAVNILGSLFYGTILGIFLTAFYAPRIRGAAAFYAAWAAEVLVLICFFFTPITYLWYNVVGCVAVVALAHPIHALLEARRRRRENTPPKPRTGDSGE